MAYFVDPVLRQFIIDNTEERRISIVANIAHKHPDRVPILVGRAILKNTPSINQCKYLVPQDFTFSKFIAEIRKHLEPLGKSASLFFFLSNNTLVPSGALLSDLYTNHKSKDGFLYITYACENTFG